MALEGSHGACRSSGDHPESPRILRPYLPKCGGTYSSEWFWSKILHCKRTSPKVFEAAWSWVELADFIPGFVTGNLDPNTMPRGSARRAQGNVQRSMGRAAREEFLASFDPGLVDVRRHYTAKAVPADRKAGELTADVAAKVGLPPGVPVAVGAFDAHMGAVGAGIKAGTLVKIIGTSTCDMLVAPMDQPLADIPGVCGIVPG